MLTCDHVRKGQKALLWTAALNFPITLLFLGVGAALFAYYKVAPDAVVDGFIATHHTDYIFPHFIKTVLTPGLRGLLIAALLAAAMSSLDSALNALSSHILYRYLQTIYQARNDGETCCHYLQVFCNYICCRSGACGNAVR